MPHRRQTSETDAMCSAAAAVAPGHRRWRRARLPEVEWACVAVVGILAFANPVEGFAPNQTDPGYTLVDCEYHGTHVYCNISGTRQEFKHPESCEEVINAKEDTGMFVEYMIAAIVAIILAGLMSGLTIGLMSFDDKNLAILKIQSQDPVEKMQAARVHSLIHDHHLLLVTLLLWNAAAFESLPLFIDKLVPSLYAVLLSVTFILIFGEILPQAICTGPRRLAVASGAYYPIKILMFISYPIAVGFAKTLDYILGTKEERNSSMMYIEPEAVGLPKGVNGGKMMLVEVHGYLDHHAAEKSKVKKAKKKGDRMAVSADDSFDDRDAILSEA